MSYFSKPNMEPGIEQVLSTLYGRIKCFDSCKQVLQNALKVIFLSTICVVMVSRNDREDFLFLKFNLFWKHLQIVPGKTTTYL